jgi:hypothetical protein
MRTRETGTALVAMLSVVIPGCQNGRIGDRTSATLTADEAERVAKDAYVFGYPLLIADVSKQLMTAVPSAGTAMKAPVNQFVHMRAFPDYTFTDVVTPNADTLYSAAWLDLSNEPVVLSVPEMGKRYYLMMLMDAWTNVFASPGTRTTGNNKGDFAIVGPRWTGTIPPSVKEIKSPTDSVWLIGRTQTNGKADYAAVHAIQNRYKLVPLSAWGTAYTAPSNVPVDPGVDAKTPPVEQVARMYSATFFGRLNTLMKDNPPAAADAPALARFAAVGVAPGARFDIKNLDPTVAKAIEESPKAGQVTIAANAKTQGKLVNGWWILPANTANFGTDYSYRAVVAMVGLGANLPEDAVYPRATEDQNGAALSGANRYVIRFPKGQLPPVNAFWSLTMYNSKQAFIENPINRYAIGDRDKLKFNADGSLTIYVQHGSPGKAKESNWLPAPPDSFNIFMRLYWPKKEVVDGTWQPPPVEHAT